MNELRTALQMPERIQVSIAEQNPRLVSVERVPGDRGAFALSFDQQFLSSLDEDELAPSIAHELGHVWIFNHHPYLQTEALANEIAMRVVSRDSLKKIYTKMWAHLGTSGNLDEFLGPEKALAKR